MTFLRFIGIWFVMAIAMASPANASDTPRTDFTILKPSSPWQVNYEANDCQLYREFGVGENKLTLRMAVGSSNTNQDFMIIGTSIPEKLEYEELQVSLNSNTTFEKISVLTYNLKDRPERVLRWFDSDVITLKKIGSPQIFRIKDSKDFLIQLNLGNLDAALSTIQTCQDSLLERWGLDAKIFREVTRQPIPKGNIGSWTNAADYPQSAFKNNISGDVAFALMIDQKGQPTGCKVTVSSGNKQLDDTTCSTVLKRARFSPALNSANEAVPSFFISRVRWVLPNKKGGHR
jgi:TonB family protein